MKPAPGSERRLPGDREYTYRRYSVGGVTKLRQVLSDHTRGIYVLEFANGEQYVGQTVSFGNRIYTHRHGSKHHAPWEDIVAIQVLDLPTEDLDHFERSEIRRLRSEGKQLRNRTFNFGYTGPSPLDSVIPVVEQQHWALGNTSWTRDSMLTAALRSEPQPLKLDANRKAQSPLEPRDSYGDEHLSRANAVTEAIAMIIGAILPDPVTTEGSYWCVVDNPTTRRGRYATLNAGRLELVYFPVDFSFDYGEPGMPYIVDEMAINFPPGTFPGVDPDSDVPTPVTMPDGTEVSVCRGRGYNLTEVDVMYLPIIDFLTLFPDWGLEQALRTFALDLMRGGPTPFRRHHSPELARRAYRLLADWENLP